MSLDLSPQDLLRNRNKSCPLIYSDGAVACLSTLTREFVTTPTQSEIPVPPFGSTRDLYRRADALYGQDDPIQYPQPYNPRFPYLACIPKQPRTESDPYFDHLFMWTTLEKHHLEYTAEGAARCKGVLKQLYAARLDDALRITTNRLLSWKQKYLHSEKQRPVLELLSQWEQTLQMCSTRIKSISTPLYDAIRIFSELRRSWLMIIAILDYDEKFFPRIRGLLPLPTASADPEFCLGTFVWTDADALQFMKIGVPFFYVRHYSDFDRQNILEVKAFQSATVCLEAANPSYPVIYTGQAGSDDKFAAIYKASVHCITSSSPFANMHLPGHYSSSYSLGGQLSSPAQSRAVEPSQVASSSGPIRQSPASSSSQKSHKTPYPRGHPSGSGKGRKNPPQPRRDLFADLPSDNPYAPKIVPTWTGVKQLVDRNKKPPGPKSKLLTIVPDPALFFGSDETHMMSYMTQWRHIRSLWLEHCRSSPQGAVENGVWRKVLGQQLWTKQNQDLSQDKLVGNGRQHRDASQASKLLDDLFQRYSPNTPTQPSSPSSISIPDAHKLLRELSLINFRYQLLALDHLVDTGRPKSGTQAQLVIATASYDQRREQLLSEIFEGSDAYSVSFERRDFGIFARDWSLRVIALRSFYKLMNSWPGEKPTVWNRGEDVNLTKMRNAGEEWERALAIYYTQTYYIHFGHPPILPLLYTVAD